MRLKRHTGEILLVLSALAYCMEWFLIRKLSALGLTSFDIVFARALFTPLIISIFFPFIIRDFFKFNSFKRHDLKYILALSATALSGSIFFNYAIRTTTVANTLILFYACVFWGILLGVLFLGEKTSSLSILYSVIAFGGICIALLKSENGISLKFGLGEISALAGSVMFALDAMFSRKIKHTNSFQRLFFVWMLIAFIYFAYTLTTKGPSYFNLYFSWQFLFYGLLLALTCGVIAKGLMFMGINRTPVSIALVILLLEPISQMFTAFLVVNESISFINLVGILIVFSMVILISRKK